MYWNKRMAERSPVYPLSHQGLSLPASWIRLSRSEEGRTPPKSYADGCCAAFTLTDLMVVVATISLLSAIVVVAGGTLRQKSKLARCTSNLQAVNRAVLTFCADNAQTLP